jgi:hypothetical protein
MKEHQKQQRSEISRVSRWLKSLACLIVRGVLLLHFLLFAESYIHRIKPLVHEGHVHRVVRQKVNGVEPRRLVAKPVQD